jgi:ferredoxin-like protein FixX
MVLFGELEVDWKHDVGEIGVDYRFGLYSFGLHPRW